MPGSTPAKPAKGPLKDDRAAPGTKRGEGASAQAPAEGADDVNPRQPGSPRG